LSSISQAAANNTSPKQDHPARIKKPTRPKSNGFDCFKKSGDTYFRTFGTIIGSESLTAVFGMGTGVTFQI
jgi:hypothetical protein